MVALSDLDIRIQNGQRLRVRKELSPIQQQGAELIDRIVRAFLMQPDKEIHRGDGRSSYGAFPFPGAGEEPGIRCGDSFAGVASAHGTYTPS